MQLKQLLTQLLRHRPPLMGNIQLTVHLHAAGIDIGRSQRGEDVIDDHQLEVDGRYARGGSGGR
ncbi:hypothetical protein D3C80_2138070 [compost metagenome]